MPRSRLLALSLVAALAVTVSACGKKEQPPPPEQGNEYVGLGDSFTAVAGYGPFDNPCQRSAEDYPALVAKKMKYDSFADASCGGAQTVNLTQSQVITGKGVNQAQLDAVSADTKLVTVGMGLNDAPTTTNGTRISYLLLFTCLPEKNGKAPKTCSDYLAQPDSGFDSVIQSLSDDVENGLEQIRQQAPNARIVLVGYPRVAPDKGTCKQLPFPPVALNRIRTVVQAADEALAKVAKKEGADYIDMWAASRGHDACSDDPWVNGSKAVKGKALQFHPYKAYHQAVAEKIVALLTKKPQA
ncbi:SGNH/GDSL hydrolase family protein [Nocardioides marmorisolisilvae]|uniref:SGNH/GDSL hydrolase family protein n=1 Tax=Nocardioides marmorisolisilvae TaxID=1542737 RepID=A0A3N0DTA6_9ACTN|nr:SGNH/GDSL hydrolase family protein [Nocardioides marmorisolisilvae]RNL78741.1 SGNH/GDSL hydrolase family protein [Nocardioides marmorisolisilvae]